jgi:hypothetical protein
VDTSGTGINGAVLKEAIRRGQIITVHRGTDGTHPTLVVEKVENPADAGSSLTLDALKDVTAPASTAAGMLLGTTGVGAWGPVAYPPAQVRATRPNTTDRLVEVWDGTAWIRVHYDSGRRDVTSLAGNLDPANTGKVYVSRMDSTVTWEFHNLLLAAGTGLVAVIAAIPQGFRGDSPAMASGIAYRNNSLNFAQHLAVNATALSWMVEQNLLTNTATQARPTVGITGQMTYRVVYAIPPALPGTLATQAP